MNGTITSPTAFNAYTNYTLNNINLNAVMRRLATGTKNVVDDGAGVAISERMRSQANSTAKSRNNVDNAISMLQTADTWMQQVQELLGRMHELAVDSNDATKTDTDRQNIQTEFGKLQEEIKRVTETAAKYNGGLIFNSTYAGLATQVGADTGQVISITLNNFSSGAVTNVGGTVWSVVVNTTGTAVSTATDANTAITNLSNAINGIAKERASIGAQQERFEKTRSGLMVYEDQIRTAESKIRSVDVARESSEMMKYQILSQIGTSILAQANQLPASVVQLVG